jgi:c-di-GMP-binding flagellar brake protein YcgR
MAQIPSEQHNDKKVSDFRGMRRILDGLINSRSLLTIIIGDKEHEFYSSAVLAVYPDEQQFVMDELNPEIGHKRLLESGTLKAYALLKGVKVFFSATMRMVSTKDGISYYVFSFPDYIYYEQQRNHYRVRVMGVSHNAINIDEIEGRLVDLSLGGIGAQFPAGTELQQGQQIHNVQLQLPDGNSIECDLEICSVMPLNDNKHVRIGAKFIQLEKNRERQLQRIVNHLEREELKHSPR